MHDLNRSVNTVFVCQTQTPIPLVIIKHHRELVKVKKNTMSELLFNASHKPIYICVFLRHLKKTCSHYECVPPGHRLSILGFGEVSSYLSSLRTGVFSSSSPEAESEKPIVVSEDVASVHHVRIFYQIVSRM